MPGFSLAAFFRSHLLEDILPHWLSAAVTSSGFFHPALDRRWRRVDPAHATLVSQSRLLYNFSVGWRLTGDAAYRRAVASGTDFLLRHFADTRHGGWFYMVSPEGLALDERKDAYGHAFVIFGLAHAARVLEREDLHQQALATLRLLHERFTDAHGGLWPTLAPDLSVLPGRRKSQNPLMHLFEAHLALLDCAGWSDTIAASAQRLACFVHHRLGDPQTGRLPEMYDDDWQELSAEQGGRIDLGHAAEWAFLLSRAVELGLSREWLGVGETLLGRALRIGEDPEGGLHSNEDPAGGLLPGEMGNWQQCELLRALIHYAARRGQGSLWPRVHKHLRFVRERFIDSDFGGWYFTPVAAHDGRAPMHSAKGSVWKLDYHVVGMCEEALRSLE